MEINTKNQKISFENLTASLLAPIQEKEKQKKRNQWKPEYSRFKLKCYYKDGNASVHYSYDIYHKYTAGIKQVITDENEGLTKLITYILSVQHKIKTAVIWVTFDKEKGTDQAQYNFEIFKLLGRISGEPTIKKTDKLYFKEGKLNLDILKLLKLQQIEKGGSNG
jgi:hypothetical protein